MSAHRYSRHKIVYTTAITIVMAVFFSVAAFAASDTTPPTAPVVTASRATSNLTQLSASWTASTDTGSGIFGYEYKVTQGSASGALIKGWTSTGTTTSVKVTGLTLVRGNYYYFSVRAKDNAGNYSAIGTSVGIRAIKFPQVGTISPSSGSTNSGAAQLFTTTFVDPDAWQNLEAGELLISTAAGVYSNCCYVSYDANRNVLLLRDDAGTGFAPNSAVAAPGSSYILENSYAILNCAQTAVSGSGKTMTVRWSITFKDASAGTKKMYLAVRDDFGAGAGWVEKGSWTVVDVNPPTGTIKINADAVYTKTTAVTLALASTDAVQMKFSNDNATWSNPESFATTRSWTLLSGDGGKTVYMKLKDAAGNWSNAISDNITLDTILPARPTINPVTTPTNVSTQTISGTRSLDTAAILVSSTQVTIGTVQYPTTTTWACAVSALNEGGNLISVKARDAAGNESSTVFAIIVLDTTPPTGTIKINNDTPYARSTDVNLTITASGAVQMRLSNDGTTWSAPETFATSKAWSLSSGDGTKTVYMRMRDAVGNWSQSITDTITLDTKPPVIVVTYPQNNAILNTPLLVVRYMVDGAAKTREMRLVEGANTLTISDADAAGNTAQTSVSVTLDTIPPVIKITNPLPLTIFDHPNITVTYTLDGNARSKSCVLNEGVNTLAVSDTDAAGNSATSYLKLYYTIPTTVQPQTGATVYSLDRRASVAIPAGAVPSTTLIGVTRMDLEDFSQAAPQDYVAEGIATFTPHGQTFAIHTTITLPLSAPEIPGTELDLGLFNPSSGLFESTGYKLIVNVDGRSATAQVSHFSTYGALKNLVSNGSPIGGGAEIPLPDLFTGSFSHQIKIETPPGRKGIEPNIALLYRSNLRNGWVGQGWDLNPGYIERDTKRGALSYLDVSQSLDLGTGADGELNVTSGTTIIDGTKNYTRVYIGPDATVTCSAWNGTSGGEIIIKCTGEVKIEGTLDVSGKGYRGGMHGTNSGNKTYSSYAGESYIGLGSQGSANNAGGGGGGRDGQNCQPDAPNGAGGGGGGYGTAGQAGNWDTYGHDSPPGAGGTTYGSDDMSSFYMGSGGGGGGCHPLVNQNGGDGGAGGGKIKICAQSIITTGTIISNGANGASGNGGGGGGSGGAIWLSGNSVSIASTLAIDGGSGGDRVNSDGAYGGGGGKGRILIKENDQRDSFVYGLTGSRMDLINLTQNLYQAKIEAGFVKFFKETDGSWTAVQKDGTKLYFGSAAASRTVNAKGVYRWLLDKIEDTNGNYMTISYSQDGGQSYISTISYTGNKTTGDLPTHTVNFILEPRNDTITSNMGGETLTTAKRLKEIDIKVGVDLARKYVFNYTYSPDTSRSLLTSIDHYGSDGTTKYPSMTFKYRGKQ